MVNALFCHKTLKCWWPLTYIQGHVIQDGCQIQSEKSILGQKIAITWPIFWQIWQFSFCFVVKYQFYTLKAKKYVNNGPMCLLAPDQWLSFTFMSSYIMYCTSPFLTENAGKIEPKCHSAILHTFAITNKCFRKSFIERNIQYAYEIDIFP